MEKASGKYMGAEAQRVGRREPAKGGAMSQN